MAHRPIPQPSDCRILIVDDEKNICEFLREALKDSYARVDVAYDGGNAIRLIRSCRYDVVVTDLKLPDMWGMEVLKSAKREDEYIEVIIITGYASFESASEAINIGVTSYLTKPLSLDAFLIHIERAVASRIFHLKSVALMDQSHQVTPEVKGHLLDITNLYYFSRKLMLGLDVPEIMRVILEEANERLDASLCVIGVNVLEFNEVFAMPRCGEYDPAAVRELLLRHWDSCYGMFDRMRFENTDVPLAVFRGRQDGGDGGRNYEHLVSLPMSVLGRTIGFIAAFFQSSDTHTPEREQFMYVFTSMAASIIEHGYRDMQAKLQAKTDSLTGVANHRMFHETLDREIARADRHKRSFCLALLDIDDFKKINDVHGHQVGDAVIIDLTRRISLQNRRGDVLARYGGEEFALILPDTPLDGARTLAQRICAAIASQPFVFSQVHIPYTVSIGLTEYSGNSPCSKDRLIGCADMALYESKQKGKNRVTTH